MRYEAFQPIPALRPFVRSIYYFMGDGGKPGTSHTFRFPSDGGPELIFNLGDVFAAGSREGRLQTFSGGSLIGPLSCHLLTRTGGLTAFVAVRFRPGGMAPFFDVPSHELTDQSVDIDTFWGAFGRQTQQGVRSAGTPEAAVNCVQTALSIRRTYEFTADQSMRRAVETISANHGQVRVGQLARTAGLSRRQFERRFKRMAGLSPKRLCRITRFANVLHSLSASSKPEWAHTAIACGYSDQAHLIRECRFFSGRSPEAYLKHRSPLERLIFNAPIPMSHLFNTAPAASAMLTA